MKDIRTFLHFYIGAWVTITNVSAYMIGQGFEDGKYVLSGEIYHFIMSGECELQSIELHPLSDMTEEEMDEVWNMEEPQNVLTMDYKSGQRRRVALCSERTAFLLSRGFDLFGLIDSGLAIDKTKLKESET